MKVWSSTSLTYHPRALQTHLLVLLVKYHSDSRHMIYDITAQGHPFTVIINFSLK